jgi:hypothetical protein
VKSKLSLTSTLPSGTAIDIEGSQLTAGSVVNGAPTQFGQGVLTSSKQLAVSGVIAVNASKGGDVQIGTSDAVTITNFGSKLSITSIGSGTMTIGDDNALLDIGGNIALLTKGIVTGGTGNRFEAVGILKTNTGGIEIGSGTTSGTINSAFSASPGTVRAPNLLTTSVLLNNANSNGAVVANSKLFSPFSLSGSTIDVRLGGVIQLDAAQPTSSVVFGANNIFGTQGNRPVDSREIEPRTEFVVDTAEDDYPAANSMAVHGASLP